MSNNNRWTEKQGREVVQQWRRSGLTLAAFARQQGCTVQRLRYWCERVGVEQRSPVRSGGAGRKQKLVPGVVVDMVAGGRISVTLPRGVVVEARELGQVDPAWVAEAVRALEEVQ
jgi:hypothetical protein